MVLIKGDGIGPEISDSVVSILRAAEAPLQFIEHKAGLACIEAGHPTGLPKETVDALRQYNVALKGPTTTPIGGGHKSVNVLLRKTLDLYSNVRPSRTLPGVTTRFDHVDLIIVRENIEDTYGGIEHMQSGSVAQLLKLNTRLGSIKISRYAFEMARAAGRKRVTATHKANIHKMTDGLFLDCFREVANEYPEIQADDILVDNACMQLVTRPEQFDVLLCPNLFGDLLSDLCAGLVGGLGVAPGGNIGDHVAVFESVHGSAPDITGKGLANPTALLQSAVMMLQHLGMLDISKRVENALIQSMRDGIKTKDLGGKAGTQEFTKGVIDRLGPVKGGSVQTDKVSKITIKKGGIELKDPVIPVGADIFVISDVLPMQRLPKKVGRLDLTMVTNRGTKIYPGEMPPIDMVNVYRCRYAIFDSSGRKMPIEDSEIIEVQKAILAAGFPISQFERLIRIGDKDGFAKGHGEG